MNAYRLVPWFVLLLVASLSHAKPLPKGEAPTPAETIQRIVEDVQFVPLVPRGDTLVNVTALPQFSAQKLAPYGIDPRQTAAAERKLYEANREKYAKDFPLRGVIFEAAAQSEEVQKRKLRMVLLAPLNPKQKAAFLLEQEPLGLAVFKLVQLLGDIKEANGQRDKEKSKRWQAAFDFALVRVESNLVSLFEYNFTLGQIRADNLPELSPDDDGWRIAPRPKIYVTEAKRRILPRNGLHACKRCRKITPAPPGRTSPSANAIATWEWSGCRRRGDRGSAVQESHR